MTTPPTAATVATGSAQAMKRSLSPAASVAATAQTATGRGRPSAPDTVWSTLIGATGAKKTTQKEPEALNQYLLHSLFLLSRLMKKIELKRPLHSKAPLFDYSIALRSRGKAKMENSSAATKIQSLWRGYLFRAYTSYDCDYCSSNWTYDYCRRRRGEIYCPDCYSEKLRLEAADLPPMDHSEDNYRVEIFEERRRCPPCSQLPLNQCCPDCKFCSGCRDKFNKNALRVYPGDVGLFCESCIWDMKGRDAECEFCPSCHSSDCDGNCGSSWVHYCGDEDCAGDCGVLACGCIDVCRRCDSPYH